MTLALMVIVERPAGSCLRSTTRTYFFSPFTRCRCFDLKTSLRVADVLRRTSSLVFFATTRACARMVDLVSWNLLIAGGGAVTVVVAVRVVAFPTVSVTVSVTA